jgi:heterodisulfide reductase subunit A
VGKKIGVFVCHCGTNISATVDVEKVAEEAKKKIRELHIQLLISICVQTPARSC